MNKDLCFKIGYVAKIHGLKGEVTIILTEAVDLGSVKVIFLEIRNSLVPYFIQQFSDRQDKVFVKFDDVNTVEQATLIKGASLYLEKAARPKLKRGEFYDDEVVGFSVTDLTTGELGNVQEVVFSGSNRLIQLIYQGKEVLIPINGPFITSVNKSKKKIEVQLPEGFLEI